MINSYFKSLEELDDLKEIPPKTLKGVFFFYLIWLITSLDLQTNFMCGASKNLFDLKKCSTFHPIFFEIEPLNQPTYKESTSETLSMGMSQNLKNSSFDGMDDSQIMEKLEKKLFHNLKKKFKKFPKN